ncbi:MAG: helix-turn-helix domain-containing protein [Devosia sp.]
MLIDAAIADRRLLDSARRVLIQLAQHANSATGAIYPSEQLLATELNLTSRTIVRAVAQLKTLGWISVIRPNTNEQNHYMINPVAVDEQLASRERRLANMRETLSPTLDHPTGTSPGQVTPASHGQVSRTSPKHLRGTPKDEHLTSAMKRKVITHLSARPPADDALPVEVAPRRGMVDGRRTGAYVPPDFRYLKR